MFAGVYWVLFGGVGEKILFKFDAGRSRLWLDTLLVEGVGRCFVNVGEGAGILGNTAGGGIAIRNWIVFTIIRKTNIFNLAGRNLEIPAGHVKQQFEITFVS